MTSKNNWHKNLPQPPQMKWLPDPWGKEKLTPRRTWLWLADTERFWQKTYQQKRYWQPHVYVWIDNKEIWLELLNYFLFNASLWPTVPFIPWDIVDIFQSYDLPTPVPPLILNEVNLSPMSYDGVWKVLIKQPWIYKVCFDFEMTLTSSVKAVEVFFESETRWTLFKYKQAASWTEIELLGEIDDPELKDWEVTPTWDPVTWRIEPEVTVKHTFEDLSAIFSTLSWNKCKNVYLNQDEVVFVKFLITPSSTWPAQWSIDDANFSLQFLRPNW